MQDSNDFAAELNALKAQVDDLASREAIRECLLRVNRGMDRRDRGLMASAFHADAVVRWGAPVDAILEEWLEQAMAMQQATERAHHQVGNILIDLHGDEAEVESYEIGRHLTPVGDEKKDLIIASRYLDKFARRDGRWLIARREKVADWIRVMEGTDPFYDMLPGKGTRDETDPSVQLFRPGAFGQG